MHGGRDAASGGAREARQAGSGAAEADRPAVREIAALPGPADPRPAPPGAKVNGRRIGSEAHGGLAGPLLADYRPSDAGGWSPPAVAPPSPPVADTGADPAEPADDSPGAVVRERVTRLLGEAADATPQPDLGTEVGRPSSRLPTEPEVPERVAICEPDGFDHRRLRTEDTSSIDGADPRRTEAR
jgi:hypothetical protein